MYVEHACMYVEHASSKGGGDTSKTPLPVRVFAIPTQLNMTMIYGLKHTYMLGDIHTCLDTSDIHTIHTYVCLSMYVCMLSMYVCMLGPLEVPPLTNLKKLNKTFNTEGFP